MILVVDDYADWRTALVKMLQGAGYEAAGVESGEEAMAWMRNRIPRLVILDYSMPGLNGLEVLSRIRGDEALCDVPVVMASAYDGLVEAVALSAGANGYIVKGSMDWEDLKQEIHRLIGPGKSAPAKPSRKRGPVNAG